MSSPASLDDLVAYSIDADTTVICMGKIAAARGFPQFIRCNNGSELIACAVRDWRRFARTRTSHIKPGPQLVQRVVMPASSLESWTVLGDNDLPVAPIERYLAYLTNIERSPNTVKAYAHDLKDYFTFLDLRGLDWLRAS